MNILLSCIGKRGYLVDYFRAHLGSEDRIIGTSNTWWTPGFAACDKAFILPDICTDDYIPAMLNLCQQEHVNGLLSLFDPDIEVLSESLDSFRRLGVVPIICSADVSHLCFDKYKTYCFLREQQWNAPATFTELEEAEVALDRRILAFPLFVKPRFGYGSRELFIARNVVELEVFFKYAPNMIIQARAQGEEYHLDIFANLEGGVVAVVPKRKIKMRSGETDQAVTIDSPDLIEVGKRLGQTLGQLGHVGPLDVDVFVGCGGITVLEMNPRFGGAYPASHLAGADFPRLVLRMLRGEKLEPCFGQFTPDVSMIKDYRILSGTFLDRGSRVVDQR